MEVLLFLFLNSMMLNTCVGKGNPRFSWTPELDKEILKIYHATSPEKAHHEDRMKVLWDHKFPEYGYVKKRNLRERAKRLIDNLGGNRIRWNKQRISWSEDLKSELIECFRDTPRDKKHWVAKIHEKWIAKHPHLPVIKPYNLVKLARIFIEKRNAGAQGNRGIRYRWPKQHAADLLYIFHHTQPEQPNHSQRIHEHWTRIHPDLAYMDRNNLKKQARTLKRKGLEFTEKENHEAEQNFMRSLQSTNPQHDQIQQYRLDESAYSPLHYRGLKYDFDNGYHLHTADYN